MSSLAQEAKAKAMPNTSAKDFSRDANECCFIILFIFRCSFSLLLSVSLSVMEFLPRLRSSNQMPSWHLLMYHLVVLDYADPA